jgi:hypothetical protein
MCTLQGQSHGGEVVSAVVIFTDSYVRSFDYAFFNLLFFFWRE